MLTSFLSGSGTVVSPFGTHSYLATSDRDRHLPVFYLTKRDRYRYSGKATVGGFPGKESVCRIVNVFAQSQDRLRPDVEFTQHRFYVVDNRIKHESFDVSACIVRLYLKFYLFTVETFECPCCRTGSRKACYCCLSCIRV